MNSYKQLYLQTAGEHLSNLAQTSHLLTTNRNDHEALDTLHRSFHSLKSQSLIMGYKQLGELAKTLELFYKQLIEKKNEITDIQINLTLEAITHMNASLNNISRDNKELDLSSDVKKINQQFSMDTVISKLQSLTMSSK